MTRAEVMTSNQTSGDAPRETAGRTTRILNLAEAAEQLRTPEATLRYWRYLGSGPRSFKIGRRVMYDSADIDEWVRHQREASSR